MKNYKLINSFYKDYKKIHDLIDKNIESECVKITRIIDRVIIYIFIINNLIDSKLKEKLLKSIQEEGYKEILEFYQNPYKYLVNTNNVNQITHLFKIDEYEKNISIPNSIINQIIKILNKYDWHIVSNNIDRQITPDVLGNVFEKYINQKEMGAYYTEEDTINYINYNSILYWLLDRLTNKVNLNNILKTIGEEGKGIRSIEELIKNNISLYKVIKSTILQTENIELLNYIRLQLDSIRIVDITCGTGAFLVKTIELLEELHECLNTQFKKVGCNKLKSKLENLVYIIENNIYGVDLMEDAIEIAKFRLYLKVIIQSIESKENINFNIKFNLKVGNTLYGNIKDEGNKDSVQELVAITNDVDKNDNRFDWNMEFESIIKEGGFDCIVGNPPYIESSKIIGKYFIDNFETLKCGNTYSFATEKAINLLKDNGIIGFIVPISIVSTKRMNSIRNLIKRECSDIFYSSFGDRPDTLFTGVHQKVTILIAKKKKVDYTNIFTSKYYHWYKEERDSLFNNVKFIENRYEIDECIYKVGELMDISIIDKIKRVNVPLSNLFNNSGNYYSYLSTRLTFWVKCFNGEKLSNEFKKYKFNSKEESLLFTAIMNSSLYYYFWEVVSDEWHITNKELELFKFDYNSMNRELIVKLCDLSMQLELNLEENKKYIGSKQSDYEYRHKKSKAIIDQIDLILKDYYKLTDDEYKYIIDYNLKYRMNDEYDSYLSSRNDNLGGII